MDGTLNPFAGLELSAAHGMLSHLAEKWSAPLTTSRTYPQDKTLRVWVPGDPATQGSKSYVGSRHYAKESNKGLPGWRADVREALLDAAGEPLRRFEGPVSAGLVFVLRRPAQPKWADVPAGKPDLDKLTRAVLDAAKSAGVLVDDALVVRFHQLEKCWAAPTQPPGCVIEFRVMTHTRLTFRTEEIRS